MCRPVSGLSRRDRTSVVTQERARRPTVAACALDPRQRFARHESLEAHLSALLDRVEGKRQALRALAGDGYRLDWFCFIDGDDGQLGLVLSHRLVVRLASLPIDLDLDIYP